jgi:hypothetical protein
MAEQMATQEQTVQTHYTRQMAWAAQEVGVMFPIVRIGHELFLLSYGGTKIDFNGTPSTYHADGDVVGAAPCLMEWRKNPGLYVRGNGYYVLGSLVGNDGQSFVVGGSFIYVTSFARDHGLATGPDWRCFDDRNLVRKMARERGGAEW